MSVSKRQKERKKVYKPYLKGAGVGGQVVRRGARVLVYQLIAAILFLFVGQILTIGGPVVRIPLNLGILAAFSALLFHEGAKAGEDDVAFSEIAHGRKEKRGEISVEEKKRCYYPVKGFYSVCMGMIPLLILYLVFAIITEKQVYRLGPLPGWVAPFERHREVELALSYYHQAPRVQLADLLRIAVRLLLFPYVNLFGVEQAEAMLILERLSPILGLIVPSFYGFGYLRGPQLRAMIHGDIASDTKRRIRRERKARKQRVAKPKQII